MLGEVLAPVVFPPSDAVSCSEDVNIAVTIYISGVNGNSILKITFYNVLGETLDTNVLPPKDIATNISPCPENIHIAITIYISGVN